MLLQVTLLITSWGGELRFLLMTVVSVERSPYFHPRLFVSVCRTKTKWQESSTVHRFFPLLFLFKTQWSPENATGKTHGLDKHAQLVILLDSKVVMLRGRYLCAARPQLVCLPPLLQSLVGPHSNIQCVCDWRRRKSRLHFIQTRQPRESNCNDNRVARWQGGGLVMEVILDIY